MHRSALRLILATALAALLVAGCGGSSGGEAPPAPKPAGPPAQPPKSAGGLTGIGSGLRGPQELATAVWTTGLPHITDLVTGPGDQLFATAADGVYLLPRGGAPQPLIRGLTAPQGLAWSGSTLIVSSTGRVDAYTGFTGHRFAGHTDLLRDLPSGLGAPGHVAAGPGGRLYLATASGQVVSFRPDGGGPKVYAHDARGAALLRFDPVIAMPFAIVGRQVGLIGPGATTAFADLDPQATAGGLAVLHGEWGSAYTLSVLASEGTLGKVLQLALTPAGAGFNARARVLLTGLSDAGPMVVRDGRLLLADAGTGTIYDIAPQTAAASTGGRSSNAAPAAPAAPAPAPAKKPAKKKPAKKQPPKAPKKTAAAHVLAVAADPAALKFTTTTLSTTAGSVQVTLDNPSPIPHNVTIAQGSKKIGATPTFTKGKKSVTLKLAPGTYTFYCSVPGHEQAGMKGTLTVK